MAEILLDLQGLKCPLPALRTRKALATLKSGDIVTVECTDPLASIDIPHLVTQSGDTIETQTQRSDVLVFRIRKA
jgi:tRNA 2-thiouridine synthesizing protein A